MLLFVFLFVQRLALTILLKVVISATVLAQKQADNWLFGERAGLTFENGSPVPLYDSKLIAYGASAVISDPGTGELLFYCNGERVWDRNHEVMPNGSGLYGSNMSTNSAYIVPVPGNEYRYYLFTVLKATYDPVLAGARVYYSIVDMTLNGGLGDVIADQKNILLAADVTEKIAAIPHVDGLNYWLILHEAGNNHFLVYEITEAGISSPVTYATGSVHRFDSDILATEMRGHMKASPDGKKIAVAVMHSRLTTNEEKPFELFDFNAATGEISGAISLGKYDTQYGVSFSPDSRKLYLQGVATNDDAPYYGDYLYQFDLDADDVYMSRTGLLIYNPFLDREDDFATGIGAFDLQLGPDGRLYGAGFPGPSYVGPRNTLFVINAPNEKGFACEVTIQRFDFRDGSVSLNLPNFIQSIFKDREPQGEQNTPCGQSDFVVFPNPTTDQLTIKTISRCARSYLLNMYDPLGRSIFSVLLSGAVNTIDLSPFSSGLYLLQIQSPSGTSVIKLIKN